MLYEIVRYFIISGFEYYAMLCLTYAFFRLRPLLHLKEILITVFLLNLTTIFNIFVIKNEFYFSTFLIVIVIVALSFYLTFKKFNYVFSSLIGISLYLIIQNFVSSLMIANGELLVENIKEISNQGEIVQIITSFVSLSIVVLMKIENGGFGYELQNIHSKIMSVLLASISPVFSIYVVQNQIHKFSHDLIESAVFILISTVSLIVLLIFSFVEEKVYYEKMIPY